MSEISIRNITNMNSLITYFAKVLGWRIDTDDFEDIEDISYDFDAEDLGLKEEAFAKIKSLRQLQPLVDGQKWGIFSIEFDSKKFEVTALRKVLSGLIPKKRNSADHAVWDQKDLLFICFWGEDNNRTIGIAHFEEKEHGLPQIKMIYCAPLVEDSTQITRFEVELGNLRWPVNVENTHKWHDDWSKAFTTGYHQTIHDVSELTQKLADEASRIRDRILDTMKVETVNGYIHQLYGKFKDILINDMTEIQFADMYAQTVVYGLFSARCMDKTQEDFSTEEAVECIPNTNPFLKSLMEECLGTRENSKLSFDELEVGNVVDLLRHTKTDAIIRDFNRQTGGGREDPVIHFYEEFLNTYDKKQKVQRGVYYTPQPVVNFIVRAVDSIIKDEFGLLDGLASTETKKIKYTRESKIRVNNGYKTMVEDTMEAPAIQILDPATGTGTFLRQTILQIYENFKEKNNELSTEELKNAWNKYVPKHLLPRLNGFELMMAPYAVAHMKLAMVLKDTGYDFESNERLNVYLTNTLDKPGNSEMQYSFFSDPLAAESIEANGVKANPGINVVMGNPPYNVSSSNGGEYILDLISDYKKGLNERKINLDDDYIKFIRLGEYIVSKQSFGILSYISNNSFLDGITHRIMRKHLMDTFDRIYIINLHGNVRKKEIAPDGSKDENVFDIQQGVSINIFVKDKRSNSSCKVYYKDLYGSRDFKYSTLLNETIDSIGIDELNPIEPYYFFVPKNFEGADDYDDGISITELFNKYNSGIQTKRDKLVVSFDEKRVNEIIDDFKTLPIEILRNKYELPKDGRDWTVAGAVDDIKNNCPRVMRYEYRPFDIRYTAYTGNSKGFMGYPRDSIMSNFEYKNIGLLTTRNYPADEFTHVLATTLISDIHAVSDQTYVFPLYLYSKSELMGLVRIPNFNKEKVCDLMSKTDYKYDESDKSVADIFSYIYGTMYLSDYRKRNKEFLKIDFPKIPRPCDMEYFNKISAYGRQLLECHLSKPEESTDLFEGNDTEVSKISYKNNRVYINKTSYFNGVEDEEWNFKIGSYLPVQHWLKDRKGHELSNEDMKWVTYIIHIIRNTVKVMEKMTKEGH